MKFSIQRFFFAAILVMSFSVPASAETTVKQEPVPEAVSDAKKVKVTIEIIIARRRDFEGFGICRVSLLGIGKTMNHATGQIYVDDASRNTLVLEINKSQGISREGYDKYLRNGSFKMEDEFAIPADVLKSLEISGTKTISAGQHRIREANGVIYVYLPIK